MPKKRRLSETEVQTIYDIYDKNIKELGVPDYDGIINHFMQLNPPVLLTKAGISYQLKQRKLRSLAGVEQAKHDLQQARSEHFETTGEQPQELDFKQSDEITEHNAVKKLRYYEAMQARVKYEQTIGNYIHVDDFTREAERIRSCVDDALKQLNEQLIPAIMPHLLAGDTDTARSIVGQHSALVITNLEQVLSNE